MRRDPIVLGQNYILSGSDVGKKRPNANALIVGTTGCGKSTSVVLPTIGRMEYSNPILNCAKETDAYALMRYLEYKGYIVKVLNIAHPDKSTVSFDPILTISSYEDIDSLSSSIVDGIIKKTVDDYWQTKAKSLCSSLITATLMMAEDNKTSGMSEVLKLFDQLLPNENGYSVETPLDHMFRQINKASPGCYAAKEYNAWHSLPYRTASCVRDTLAACLSAVFPESIRRMMREKPQFDAENFAIINRLSLSLPML